MILISFIHIIGCPFQFVPLCVVILERFQSKTPEMVKMTKNSDWLKSQSHTLNQHPM